jgi:hypothetical protein
MFPELVSEVRLATHEEPYKESHTFAVHLAQRFGIEISRGNVNTIRRLLHFRIRSRESAR